MFVLFISFLVALAIMHIPGNEKYFNQPFRKNKGNDDDEQDDDEQINSRDRTNPTTYKFK